MGEGVFLDFVVVFVWGFFFFLLPGLDWPDDGNIVVVEPKGGILLDCGLPWGDSFLTEELRTGVGWVILVLTSSRPDVLTKFRPVGGVPALVIGLDGVLCML